MKINHKELGDTELNNKNYTKAIEHYTNALNDGPKDFGLYANRSCAYCLTE